MQRCYFITLVIICFTSCHQQDKKLQEKNLQLVEGIFCKWHQVNDSTYEVYIKAENDTCTLYMCYEEIDKTAIHYLKKNGKPNIKVVFEENKDSVGKVTRVVKALVPVYD